MIRIVDTYPQINSLFDDNSFNIEKWEKYINTIYENSAHLFKDEMEAYFSSGKYTFENDFLPIMNAVSGNPKLDVLHQSFLTATNNLNQKIIQNFGQELDTDIVLYLGLCNAAGWVTVINGRQTIMLGVEKIIELGWHNLDSMYALIYHELGHVYHAQYGELELESEADEENFVWQLFTEGIAMYFEQMLVGDSHYFHQGGADWVDWCDSHFSQILHDFNNDLPTMTRFDQRYFGDWVDYDGHGDVGYYLGTKFVQELMKTRRFDEVIRLDKEMVVILYHEFSLGGLYHEHT